MTITLNGSSLTIEKLVASILSNACAAAMNSMPSKSSLKAREVIRKYVG